LRRSKTVMMVGTTDHQQQQRHQKGTEYSSVPASASLDEAASPSPSPGSNNRNHDDEEAASPFRDRLPMRTSAAAAAALSFDLDGDDDGGGGYARSSTSATSTVINHRSSIIVGVAAFVAGAAIGVWGGGRTSWSGAVDNNSSNAAKQAMGVADHAKAAEDARAPPQPLLDEAYLDSPEIVALLSSLTDELTSGSSDSGSAGTSSTKAGPLSVLTQASDRMNADDTFLDNCHHFVHRLGRAAYRALGVEGAFAGLLGTDDAILLRVCNGAYLHGIIETHLKEADDPIKAALELDTSVCVPLRNVPLGTWECRHGIGHGLIQHARNERDEQTISDAIASCQNKYFDIPSTRACENGAWMDFFVSGRYEGGFSFDERSSSPSLRLCANSDTQVPNDCAMYSPTEYLLHRPRDYYGAIQWCLSEDDDSNIENSPFLQKNCVGGVGMQTAKENLRDYTFVENTCMTAPKEYQSQCMDLAFTYRSFSTGESTMPKDICLQLQHFKGACLNYKH